MTELQAKSNVENLLDADVIETRRIAHAAILYYCYGKKNERFISPNGFTWSYQEAKVLYQAARNEARKRNMNF